MEMFQFVPIEIDIPSILPILMASLGGIIGLLLEIMSPRRNASIIAAVSLLFLAAAIAAVLYQFGITDTPRDLMGGVYGGTVFIDRFGLTMQLLILIGAVLSVLFSESYLKAKQIHFGEFYPIVMWCVVGGLVMCSTRHLLMLFLGIEILSIALYVLAGLSRREERSEESALKYFLLGAFASGFLLYGIAMYYGASGSLHLDQMGRAWFDGQGSTKSLLAVGTALILIGLGFKASFVPFHQWTPDVYQGAPTNVTAFMAAASKVGAFAALWRILEATPFLKAAWMPALGVIAVLTMVVGNVMALVQKDVKRVLAYSSISHAGYILVAILAHFRMPDRIPFSTVGYYLLVYTLMTIGAFAVISLGAKPKGESVTLADLRGLRHRAPLASAALIVFMLSLAGVPPMSGFFGKLMIFNDAMRAYLQPLAIALAINSIVSAFYYLQIAKAAYVDEPETEHPPIGKGLLAGVSSTSVVCVAGIVLATFLVSPVLEFFGGNREVATPVRAPSQPGP